MRQRRARLIRQTEGDRTRWQPEYEKPDEQQIEETTEPLKGSAA